MEKAMNVTVTQAANELTQYWGTYGDQTEVDDHTESIFLEDALYSIGIAMNNEEFSEGSGNEKFKWMLFRYLEGTLLHKKSPREAWNIVVKTYSITEL
jgi:hypothetical protein